MHAHALTEPHKTNFFNSTRFSGCARLMHREPYGTYNESASVDVISVLREIITQSESSGSGTTGNQLLSS